MSTGQTPPDDDLNPVPLPGAATPMAGSLAADYVAQELRAARVDLSRARIIGVISVVVIVAYLGALTAHFADSLRPSTAAEIADGIVAEHLQDQAPAITTQLRQQIPMLINQAPGALISQLPQYRAQLEDQFQADLTRYCRTNSKVLDDNVDQFVTANKDQIKTVLADGQNKAAVTQLGGALSQQLVASLKSKPSGGESIQDKLDQSATALQQIKTKMDRLANASDLTPEEKKTRHAIAIMAKTINAHVTPDAVKQVTASAAM